MVCWRCFFINIVVKTFETFRVSKFEEVICSIYIRSYRGMWLMLGQFSSVPIFFGNQISSWSDIAI